MKRVPKTTYSQAEAAAKKGTEKLERCPASYEAERSPKHELVN